MPNISATEILKMHGKWIKSNEFHRLIAEKLEITERQAYNLTKKSKEIIKITLQDRTVLYGLPEFGLPQLVEDEKLKAEKEKVERQPFNEVTIAEAINKMRAFEALSGYRFSQAEWNYVLDSRTDEELMNKANAIVKLRRFQALFMRENYKSLPT